ncbi:MAG: hypothetical protein KJ731_03015 [Alphaproteobacteria bacterium]|nr:hypothetical protein [Alphaproteobacteria bacterium]MBU1278670.1 hypothetical protein [Alphaproteobacteria bacterium]MBU1575099.1 hypothetical protein [Alphaproteobacteria bacterium]MBU1827438.1 hypothetical protein [Alphaproteobacteria bacterium]MBU2076559.1 hypothetical protein [Alphaproteobacteria bacterium]
MSYSPHDPFGLDPAREAEGAEPVGRMDQLDAQGRMVVALMRGAQIAGKDSDISKVYGQMMMVFERHARRPLMRHHPDCACLGADEAVMARFVRLAARGAREDAALMAMLLIRADIASLAVSLAEQLGLLIQVAARVDAHAMRPHGAYH